MVTLNYKGHYIHDNFTDNKITVQFMHDNTWTIYTVKSFRAGQLLITKLGKK